MTTHRFCLGVSGLVSTFALCLGASAQELPSLGEPFATDPPLPFLYDASAWDIGTATNGETQLVVLEEGGAIRGMITDALGQPTSTSMLALDALAGEGSRYYPCVASGGGHYLVAWNGEGIAAQLVESDGTLLGTPVVVDTSGYYPAVAWNGSDFVVAWRASTAAGGDIKVSRIDASGNILSTEQLTTAGDATEPQLAVAGNTALVTWYTNPSTSSTGIQAALLGSSAEPLGSGVFQVSTNPGAYEVQATSSGENYLVSWAQSDSEYSIRGALVSTDGTVSSEVPIASCRSLAEPVVGFDGEQFALLWQQSNSPDPSSTLLQHVSLSGALDAAPTTLDYVPADTGKSPALLWTGDDYWFVYPGEGIFGVLTDSSLTPLGEPVGLSLVEQPQDGATVLFDGIGYVITWSDERDGPRIFSGHAVRVDTAGQVLDPEAIHLSTPEDAGSYVAAATAGDGSTLTAWTPQEGDGAFLRLIHSDGTLGSTTPLTDLPLDSTTLASNGTGYLAVYTYSNSDYTQYSAMAQPIDANGVLLGEPIELRTQTSWLDGGVHAMADGYVFEYRDTDSFLMPLASDGSPGASEPFATGGVTLGTETNGSETLLVWSEGSSDVRYGRFRAESGWVGERFTISEDGRWGDTAWDGTRFVDVSQSMDYHASMRAIELDGTMTEALSLFADEECNGPELGSNGEGQLLLSCVRYMDGFRTRRLVNYLMGSPTAPATVDPGEDPDPGTPEQGTGGRSAGDNTSGGTSGTGGSGAVGGTEPPPSGVETGGSLSGGGVGLVSGTGGMGSSSSDTGSSSSDTGSSSSDTGSSSSDTGSSSSDTGSSSSDTGSSSSDTGSSSSDTGSSSSDTGSSSSAGAAGAAPESPSLKSDSGCSVVTTSRRGVTPWTTIAMLVAAASVLVRRRRS